MGQRVAHGLADQAGEAGHQLGTQVAAHRVAAQGQGQTRLLLPPGAEIEHLLERVAAVGELALVDDQASVGAALLHLVQDAVEGDHVGVHLGSEQLQGQERRGQGARHGDPQRFDALGGQRLAGHEQGAVAVADGAATGHERVLVRHVGVGVERDRGDLVFARHGLAVQGLDVGQDVADVEVAGRDLALGQAVEHERVVAVGAVGEGDLHVVREMLSRRGPAHSRAERVTSATM